MTIWYSGREPITFRKQGMSQEIPENSIENSQKITFDIFGIGYFSKGEF